LDSNVDGRSTRISSAITQQKIGEIALFLLILRSLRTHEWEKHAIALNPQSKFYSRRTAAVLLLVGVLAGVTVGGGVGVIAASSTKIVTVCANKKTNILRYAKIHTIF
jgi:hypothetical protein